MIISVSCDFSAGSKWKQTTHSDRMLDSLNSHERKATVSLPANYERQPAKSMDNDHQSSFNVMSQSKLHILYAQQQPTSASKTFVTPPTIREYYCNNINKSETRTETSPVDHELKYENSGNSKISTFSHLTGTHGWLNPGSVNFADHRDNSNNISDHQSFDNVPLREKILQHYQQSICLEPMNKQVGESTEKKCCNSLPDTKIKPNLIENSNIVSSSVRPTKEATLFRALSKNATMNKITNNDYNEHQTLVIQKDNGSAATLFSSNSLCKSITTLMPIWLTRLFSDRCHQDYISAPKTKICDYSPSEWVEPVAGSQHDGGQTNQDTALRLHQLSMSLDDNRYNLNKSNSCYADGNDSPANFIGAPMSCIVVNSDQCGQHHSMVNRSTSDKNYKYGTNASAVNEIPHQSETVLSPTHNTCFCCCRLELNQPKDYKFYLLVCLMIIGLISVVMVAVASVMIYLDSDGYRTFGRPTSPFTSVPIATTAADYNKNFNRAVTTNGSSRPGLWIVQTGDSSRIHNRYDTNSKKDDGQTISNSKYSFENRGLEANDDPDCANIECRHHARCRKLSETNATTMVQCYCPTTCNELLKTISIHHMDNTEGVFIEKNNLATTTKRPSSNASHTNKANNQIAANANSHYPMYNNNNDGDDDDYRDKNTTRLRDTQQFKSVDKPQPQSAFVAPVDSSAKPISKLLPNDNGANSHSIQYPLCGTDGNDYSTLCQLLNSSCIHQIDIRVKSIGSCKSCSNIECLHYSRCQMSESLVPHCVCPRDCQTVFIDANSTTNGRNNTTNLHMAPFINTIVCGSNMVTYDNECQMRLDSCKLQQQLTVKYSGKCDKCRDVTCTRGRYCKEGRCICQDRCESETENGNDDTTLDELATSNGDGAGALHSKAHSNEISMISQNRMDNQLSKLNQFSNGTNNSLQYHHRRHYHQRGQQYGEKQLMRSMAIGRRQQHLSICANDGNTYRNQCELLRHACLNSLDLRPLFYGSCDDQFEDQLLFGQEQHHHLSS